MLLHWLLNKSLDQVYTLFGNWQSSSTGFTACTAFIPDPGWGQAVDFSKSILNRWCMRIVTEGG